MEAIAGPRDRQGTIQEGEPVPGHRVYGQKSRRRVPGKALLGRWLLLRGRWPYVCCEGPRLPRSR
eukprot:9454606-Pyramimonas_sp.AAC.1